MKKFKQFLKNSKVLTLIFCLTIAFTVIFAISTNASAEESTTVEPRSTILPRGEYRILYTDTIPSSIGYFEVDIVFTDLSYGYEDGMTAPYWRLRWNLQTRTLSIYAFEDSEEIVLYKDGIWLSRQAFSIYLLQATTTVTNDTYAQRFLALYENTATIPVYFNVQSDGYTNGILDGYNTGYELGYDNGLETGTAISKPFSNIIGDIFDGLDNFVIFGDFSLLDIIKSIMGIFLAVWLLKLIAGG